MGKPDGHLTGTGVLTVLTSLKLRLASGALSRSQFRWFYLARTISVFGSGMTPVALAFAVLQAPDGHQLLGYVLAAEILPSVLLVLIGGSVADRYRRDRLIQLSNLGSAATQGAIAALVLTGASPVWLFPLAVANGGLSAFASPAMRGLVPEVVSAAQLGEANALLNTSRAAARILGPTAAGLLVATLGGGWGIALDALSFLLAAACMARVAIPTHPKPAEAPSLAHQLREGWDYFRQQRPIWAITLAFAAINVIWMGVWRVLGPLIAQQSFGPAGWGMVLSVRAVGLLAAGILMMRRRLRHPLREGMVAAAALGLPLIALGARPGLVILMLAAGLAGFGSTVFAVTWDAALQQAVPRDKLSRVLAFDDFGSYITIPLAVILAVPIGHALGFYPVAFVGGLLVILLALLPLAEQTVRTATLPELEAAWRTPPAGGA